MVIQKIANEVCEDSFRSASARLRGLQGAGPYDVVDCTVTCDGIWSCPGFVANYSVVAVLSWETGQVLDVVVLSKSCKVCKEAEHSEGVPGMDGEAPEPSPFERKCKFLKVRVT